MPPREATLSGGPATPSKARLARKGPPRQWELGQNQNKAQAGLVVGGSQAAGWNGQPWGSAGGHSSSSGDPQPLPHSLNWDRSIPLDMGTPSHMKSALCHSYHLISSFLRQGLLMLPRLAPKSWAQGILLPQPPE